MLDALFAHPALPAVVEALTSARADAGPLAVLGNAKLATALAEARKDNEIIAVGISARAAKRLPNVIADLSSVDEHTLTAVIGIDIAEDETWEDTLRQWSRVVRDGGIFVFIDKGHAAEASRRALCAGLTEIEQRHAGRTIVTSGRVTHL